jgi:hypothetical protein
MEDTVIKIHSLGPAIIGTQTGDLNKKDRQPPIHGSFQRCKKMGALSINRNSTPLSMPFDLMTDIQLLVEKVNKYYPKNVHLQDKGPSSSSALS